MKKHQYQSATIICPCYKKEEKQVIYCSGILPNTSTHVAFANAADSRKHKDNKCRKDYEACPVYRMVTEGVDDE